MKWKVQLVLIIIANMMFSSVTEANFGYGMYGGIAACPYPWGGAGGASDEEDDIEEMVDRQREVKQELRELKREFKKVETEYEKASGALSTAINGDYIDQVLEHMDGGYNCASSCEKSRREESEERGSDRRRAEVRDTRETRETRTRETAETRETTKSSETSEKRDSRSEENVSEGYGQWICKNSICQRIYVKAINTQIVQAFWEEGKQQGGTVNNEGVLEGGEVVEKKPRRDATKEVKDLNPKELKDLKIEVPLPPVPAPEPKPAVDPKSNKKGHDAVVPEEERRRFKRRSSFDIENVDEFKNILNPDPNYFATVSDAEAQALDILPYYTLRVEEPSYEAPMTPAPARMPATAKRVGRGPASDDENQEVKAAGTSGACAGLTDKAEIDDCAANPHFYSDKPSSSGSSGGAGSGRGACPSDDDVRWGRPSWKRICRNGGKVDPSVCRDPKYANSRKASDVNACVSALSRYKKLGEDQTKLQNQIAALETEDQDLRQAVREARRELAKAYREGDMEAYCPTCVGSGHRSRYKGPSTTQTLIAGGLDALGIFLGYKANKDANKFNAKTGWPAQSWINSGYGFPYRLAGLYGGVGGGINGGFGCGGGMNGGGFNGGPWGGLGPWGLNGGLYGQMGGPFGYPMGMGGPFGMGGALGGGMFMPGAGPWGMAGPWGNGPYGAGGPFGPWAGIGGGAGIGGPFGSPFGGGPFGPFAGGFNPYGGIGAGLMGGAGFGNPMMNPYMMGGAGLGGMGGNPFMNPFGMPGLYNGYPFGLDGGMGMGGMGGPFGMPGMMGGGPFGMGGAGAGGLGLQYQQQMMQMQMQQYQTQMDMQRRASEAAAAKMRMQQGLMSQYYELMMKFQQLQTGFGSGILGFDYGLGGTFGGSLGGSFGTSILPSSTFPTGTGTTSGGSSSRNR